MELSHVHGPGLRPVWSFTLCILVRCKILLALLKEGARLTKYTLCLQELEQQAKDSTLIQERRCMQRTILEQHPGR